MYIYMCVCVCVVGMNVMRCDEAHHSAMYVCVPCIAHASTENIQYMCTIYAKFKIRIYIYIYTYI